MECRIERGIDRYHDENPISFFFFFVEEKVKWSEAEESPMRKEVEWNATHEQ